MKVPIPAEAAHCAEAYAAAYTEAALEERARISAIITGPAGAARPKMAMSLAMNTDMSAEAAEAFMADLPAEQPAAKTPSLADRHAAAGTGAGAEGPGGAEAAAALFKPQGGLMKKAASKVAQRRDEVASEVDGGDGSE